MINEADCAQDDFLADGYGIQYHYRGNARIDTILVGLGSSNQNVSQDQRHNCFLASYTVRIIFQTRAGISVLIRALTRHC